MFVFTAYLDESGTHDDLAVTVMGGAFARAQQWDSFRKEFDELRQRYGFRVFHTRKFKKRTGDFAGWSNEKCISLTYDLGRLTNAHIADGCAVSLMNEHYKKHYAHQRVKGVQLELKIRFLF